MKKASTTLLEDATVANKAHNMKMKIPFELHLLLRQREYSNKVK